MNYLSEIPNWNNVVFFFIYDLILITIWQKISNLDNQW
jgi:hypothetical protein